MRSVLFAVAILVSTALAAPVHDLRLRQNGDACASVPGDAPYSLSCAELASRVELPRGFQGREGGIVFLVHGTGSQGSETWGSGPYFSILPDKGPGYDIAWFNSPTRSLGDAQITAEYIAYNIRILAQRSRTNKVFVVAHSQGCINVQWAMAFFPSIKQYISGYSALAGDFRGTALGPLACTAQGLLQGGCPPSIFQQSIGSRYLRAQNSIAPGSLVNTLAVYTIYDEIVQPQAVDSTSTLPGANNVKLQDLDICSPAFVTDHFGITVAAPAFYATLQLLTTGRFDRSRFQPLRDCSFLGDSNAPDPFVVVPGLIKQAALDAIAVVTSDNKVRAEPRLRPYVCARGAASSYCA